MKRTSFWVLMGAMVVLLTACQCSGVEKMKSLLGMASQETVHIVCGDSVQRGDDQVMVKYDCVLPCGGKKEVMDSVLMWVLPQIGDTTMVADFLLDIEDMDSVKLEVFFNNMVTKQMREYRAGMEADENPDYGYSIEIIQSVKVTYEDDKCITYTIESYMYLGGAHGMQNIVGATFSKEDGHRLDYKELLPDMSKKQIREEVVEGLMEYFEYDTEMKLKESLFLDIDSDFDKLAPATDIIPLPVTKPWRETDGVHLQYQEYEICCYADGLPAVVIKPAPQQK